MTYHSEDFRASDSGTDKASVSNPQWNLVALNPTENPRRSPQSNPVDLPPVTLHHSNDAPSQSISNNVVEKAINVQTRGQVNSPNPTENPNNRPPSNPENTINKNVQYVDKSIFLSPVEVPTQLGSGIKVHSSVNLDNYGSNTVQVDSGVDSRSFSAGVALPGLFGITAGGGSADIPDAGKKLVETAGRVAVDQTNLFWGRALSEDPTTKHIGGALTRAAAVDLYLLERQAEKK